MTSHPMPNRKASCAISVRNLRVHDIQEKSDPAALIPVEGDAMVVEKVKRKTWERRAHTM